jgi:hypothetical protein
MRDSSIAAAAIELKRSPQTSTRQRNPKIDMEVNYYPRV